MARQDVELQFRLIDGVTRSLAGIQQGVTGLGASIVKVNAAAELTGKAFSGLQAAAGALGGLITSAAGVEDALARVRVITGATAEEQVALQQAIRDAVATTRFSAAEAAQALVLLAEDGFTAAQAADELGRVLAFAQANARGAAETIGALGAAFDFGDAEVSLGRVADQLTAVGHVAGGGVGKLTEAFERVAVAAGQANVPIETTIAALGALAAAGIDGGRSGAVLTTILQDLQNPASAAGRALDELGLRGRDFVSVLGALSRDSAAAEQVLSALGNRPRAALRALLTEGGGDLQRFEGVIQSATGSTQAAADVLNNTFAGALDRISSRVGLLRDEFAQPLLEPLATQIDALAERLRAFSETPEFDNLVASFERIAEAGIDSIGDLVENLDFEEAIGQFASFAQSVSENLDSIGTAAKTVSDILLTAFDVIRGGTAIVAGALSDAGSKWADFVEAFGIPADNLGLLFDDIGQRARALGDDSLLSLERRFGDTSRAADGTGSAIQRAGSAARGAETDLKRLALSLLPTEFRVATEAALRYRDGLREIIPIIEPLEAGQRRIGIGAIETATSLATLQAALADVRQRLAEAPIGSEQFARLAAEARNLSEKVEEAREQVEGAAGSFDRMREGAQGAAGALSDFAGAAGDAASAADGVRERNSAVSDSFGNIGRNVSAVGISLGNLSEQYVRQALAAAAAASSGADYARTLSRLFEAGERRAAQVDREIARMEELLELQDKDRQIREEVIREFGTESTRIEELIELRKRLAEIQERNIAATRTERQEIEQLTEAQARSAGGIGGRVGAPGVGGDTAAPAGASVKEAPPIVVNINGLPSTRAAWEDLVREQVVPVLDRIGRLSR